MQRLARFAFTIALAVLASAGCERRDTPRAPGGIPSSESVRQSELQPGMPVTQVAVRDPYENDPHALAEGKRFYDWYNCSGCHFGGGGGIGPPLMDDDWIYGGEPQNILASMLEGRPNGMPSYRGRLPQDHALKIVAYVRSLSRDAQTKPDQQEDTTEDTTIERTPSIEETSAEEADGSDA